MAQQITYDKAYDAVAPEDFAAMLEVPRYGRRTNAFDSIISATHDHFWDPLDKSYIDFDQPFDLTRQSIMPDEAVLEMRCEAVTRLEPNGTPLPDALFRLRVLQSDLSYDNFVVERVAGVGGEAAKVLGDTARGSLKQWRPSLEHDLLARANAAIVKAGDTKEVRLSLVKLFNSKDQLSAPALGLITGQGQKRQR